MKKLLIILFSLASVAAFGQAGSTSHSVYRSRVNDSTLVNGAHAQGYGDLYWNNQATTPGWRSWNGSSYDVGLGGGGAAATSKVWQGALTDEVTVIQATASVAKITFRMPYAMTLTAVRASLVTAQATGTLVTLDVKEGGVTIFSTLLTFDNTETTTTTALTPAVISDSALADDAEITIFVTVVGDGTAKGVKITFIGT